jgi:hypothetical protein
MLCACTAAGNQNPTQPQPSDPTNASKPTENGDPVQTTPDTVLEMDTLDLQSLKNEGDPSYVLIESDGETSRIYQIYACKLPDATIKYRIRYFETEKVTAAFATGAAVAVKAAWENVINAGDYHIFNSRFYAAKEQGFIHNKDVAWQDHVYILLTPETGEWMDLTAVTISPSASDCDAEDYGMVQFMYLMYKDRGIGRHGVQHFPGVVPAVPFD